MKRSSVWVACNDLEKEIKVGLLCWWNVMRHMATCLRNTMNKCYERNCQKNKMIRLSYTQYPYRSVGDHHTVSCLKKKLEFSLFWYDDEWVHLKKETTTNKVQRHPYFPVEWMIHRFPFFFSLLLCFTTSVAVYVWQEQNKNKRGR
jgi:hypothetical protein